ncbi:MAG: hypothetical protein FK733_05290 [Asgard group archaeon]|nr:hypothetical protein [Asgard group archaeon]
MTSIKNILIAFFDDEAKEVRSVIEKVRTIPLDAKLTAETRTVLELINHIAQIPRIDVNIYSGKFPSGEDTRKTEEELNRKSVDDVLKVFDESCQYLKTYFKDMTDDEILEKKLRPFYEPDSQLQSWDHFLSKLAAHLALHKGVLWSYLKIAKSDVNMFTYYGR